MDNVLTLSTDIRSVIVSDNPMLFDCIQQSYFIFPFLTWNGFTHIRNYEVLNACEIQN